MRIMTLISLFLTSVSAYCFEIEGFAIRYSEGNLSLLNQQKLPQEVEWLDISNPEEMVKCITSLQIRGAPMIGLAAALSLSQLSMRGASRETLLQAAELLRNSRPTAVNLAIYIERIIHAMENRMDYQQAVIDTALELYHEDASLCHKMGKIGASLIKQGENILTVCNTGSLATAGIGTALGVIKTAHSEEKNILVYVCETRPLLQGGRLTTWELEQCGIPYVLICDSMAATLMRQGKIQRVLVGADRIAANGDFANKIGTYSIAVLAQYHKIPFHVVAPHTTLDYACPNGSTIKIEERSPDEVRGVAGSFGKIIWSPHKAPIYNPAFDVTPSDLVTSYILDTGNWDISGLLNQLEKLKSK